MSKTFKRTLYGLIILGALVLLYFARSVLWPFVLSALLAYFLNPLINYFELFAIRRMVVVLFLYVFVVGLIAGTLVLIAPAVIHQTVALNQKLPEYIDQAKGMTLLWQWKIEKKFPMIKEKDIFNKTAHGVESALSGFLDKIPSYLLNLFSLFALLIVVPFATFFFIVDGKRAMNALYRSLPPRYIETTLSLISEIDEAIGKYIRYQLIEAAAVGVLAFVGLLIIGVNYSLLIGITAGLANIIPYLGPAVGIIIGLIVGFVQFKTFSIIIQVLAVFAVVKLIDDNFIQPLVLSKGTNLHPMIIFFSVIAGAEIMGIIGMLFAVPVAVIIKVTLSILFKGKNYESL